RTAPTTTTWLGTGNNMVVAGDIGRRVLMCQIDPQVERPEDSRFDFDPVDYALRKRPELVAAGLTLLRAHQVAGQPQGDVGPFGSFERWTETVAAAIVWAGLESPLIGLRAVAQADTKSEAFHAFIEEWHASFGDRPMTIREALRSPEGGDSLTNTI